jgi:hypothetical protein
MAYLIAGVKALLEEFARLQDGLQQLVWQGLPLFW